MSIEDKMSIRKEIFGKNGRGECIASYIMTNENGLELTVIELGAALQSLKAPDRKGQLADVVLGYDNVGQYEKGNSDNLGVVIGRNANRIKDGRFVINGKEYQLAKNDGGNNLHSGPEGYSSRKWDSRIVEDERGAAVCFSLNSPDGDQGMPGELDVSVTYVLTEDNDVIIEYDGVAGEDTVVNMTNHSYFNLAGHSAGDVYSQLVWIDADEFTPSDGGLIPTGEYRSVKGTPLDFTVPKPVGQDIHSDYEQLVRANGYDHNFVLKNQGELALVASLEDQASGRFMEVYTELPGLQLYSGNFLNGKVRGKENCYYRKGAGICFESQFFPDSVNNMAFESPVVEAGVPFNFVTVYKFSVR